MPRINEQENLHDTLVENKESKCNFSNRCKLVLCISASLIVMVGLVLQISIMQYHMMMVLILRFNLYWNRPFPIDILFFLHNFDASSKLIGILSFPTLFPDLKIIL